jgi:membrane protein implicated in regulation of membrane protease activity
VIYLWPTIKINHNYSYLNPNQKLINMLDISIWWSALSLPLKIYWAVAIPFTLMFVFQLIMTFVGADYSEADAAGDSDAAIDADAGIDFQFITLKNLIAFFTIFGWSGIACLSSGMGLGISVIISFVAGLIMMTIMASMMWFMGKLTDNGTLRLKNAIGKTGTVYLPVPPKRSGTGQIQIKVQGLQTLDAMTDDTTGFKTGQVVEVTEVLKGDILLIR